MILCMMANKTFHLNASASGELIVQFSKAELKIINGLMSDSWKFEVYDWLIRMGIRGRPLEEILEEYCNRLCKYGISLERAVVAISTLHPLIVGIEYAWNHESGNVKCEVITRFELLAGLKNSPFSYMASNKIPFIRGRLLDKDPTPWFPIYNSLQKQGISDYVAFAHFTGDHKLSAQTNSFLSKVSESILSSFSTKQGSGFKEDEVTLLQSLSYPLALLAKSYARMILVKKILGTYVGLRPSEHILSGKIERGSLEMIQAVIWFGDLCGFTKLSDSISSGELIQGLNEYLEVVSRPVTEQGGEVLKYMGDGILAIFELSESAEAVADRAVSAAKQVFQNLFKLTEQRKNENKITFEFDLVLHVGEVSYGNIGAEDRLDFTVIGPVVNEASRIESLCESLGCHLLLSKDFISLITAEQPLKSLGKHKLRGVQEPKEIFTLASVKS